MCACRLARWCMARLLHQNVNRLVVCRVLVYLLFLDNLFLCYLKRTRIFSICRELVYLLELNQTAVEVISQQQLAVFVNGHSVVTESKLRISHHLVNIRELCLYPVKRTKNLLIYSGLQIETLQTLSTIR